MLPPARALLRRSVAALAGGALAAGLLVSVTTEGPATAGRPQARATNPVTPGDFTGYGFDQCLTPDQHAMDRWLQASPFLAVGVYISGKSRACRDQPNLTKKWVATQLRKGWRILPITLGPQASCQPRFPRYGNDPTIIPKPGRKDRYPQARAQGRAEGESSVAAAQALGLTAGSTLWYDLEGFDLGNTHCRESALAFLSGWTNQVEELDYATGVYSSAGSGIKMLDDARHAGRDDIVLPDYIWIARWDGKANVETEPQYLRADGWRPHARVKQYQGGHDERWGGVTINIDRNYLDVGRGSFAEPEEHCGGIKIAAPTYDALRPATERQTPEPRQVKALQCLLQENADYAGALTGVYGARTQAAAQAWQADHGFKVSTRWGKSNWMSLLVAGDQPLLKYGSAGPAVRRLQRALNAMTDRAVPVQPTGVFGAATTTAVKAWQTKVGLAPSGVVTDAAWAALAAGRRR